MTATRFYAGEMQGAGHYTGFGSVKDRADAKVSAELALVPRAPQCSHCSAVHRDSLLAVFCRGRSRCPRLVTQVLCARAHQVQGTGGLKPSRLEWKHAPLRHYVYDY